MWSEFNEYMSVVLGFTGPLTVGVVYAVCAILGIPAVRAEVEKIEEELS